jgi:hypothetical protein
MGIMIPAFTNVGKSTSLNSAGNQVVNLLNLARSHAMARNVMTAVILLTDDSAVPGTGHRAVVVMELAPKPDGSALTPADWKQVSRVEELSQGIVVEPGAAFASLESGSNQPLPAALPAIKFRGKDISIDSHPRVVFMPNGSLLDGQARKARLSQGYIDGGTFRQTGPTNNYYEVTVMAASGRTKVERP